MFKTIWKQKKDIIQLGAIIIAIGAIFLSINLPENNEVAREALLNVQFTWLLIISIILFILFVDIFVIVNIFLKKIMVKKKINLGFLLFSSISIFFSWILFNLWIYILNLYKESFKNFIDIQLDLLIWGALFMFFTAPFLMKKFFFPEKSINIHKYLYPLISAVLISIFLSLFITIRYSEFSLGRWVKTLGYIIAPSVILFYTGLYGLKNIYNIYTKDKK